MDGGKTDIGLAGVASIQPKRWTVIAWAFWALASAVVVLALGAACSTADEIPPPERRAHSLNKAIMCPVCPGESIDQSQNPLAKQMRGIVSDRLSSGWTEDQIKDFFVDRYGLSVLMEPPRRGFSLLAWALPSAGAVGAATALFLALRLMRRSPPTEEPGLVESLTLSDEEQREYFRRVEAALGDDLQEADNTS